MTRPDSTPHLSRRATLGLLGAVPVAAGILSSADSAEATTISPAAYERFLQQLADKDGFSGTVLLAHRGRTVLAKSYGLADRERRIRNGMDTIYNLASAAKPFTGLAIVQLAEKKLLRFHDTVGVHLDGFPAEVADHVTIHQLLTHTSGLTNLIQVDPQHVTNSIEEEISYQNENTRTITPTFTPGTRHSYSSAGFLILGEIVAKVSGQPFHTYVRQNIFIPAGMTSSAYYTRPDWLANRRIAHPYIYQSDGTRVDGVRNLGAGAVLNGGQGSNAARGFLGSGGGGGFSTVRDLLRFAQALEQPGKLLKRAYAELYLSPKFPPAPLAGMPAPTGSPFAAYGPGSGITNDQRVIGHGGGIAGGNTNWTIYRDSDWFGAILCNYDFDIQTVINQERDTVFGAPLS